MNNAVSLRKQPSVRANRVPYVPNDPLLTAREAALERGQGLSTFWRDVKSGRVPKPFYVSPRAPRWRLSEIVESVNACRNARVGERS